MTFLKLTYTKILLAALCVGCSTSQKSELNTVYYNKFDIFRLSGIDTLSSRTIKKKPNPEFVEVSYTNGFPNVITYHFADRKVILKLEDTLKFQNRNIYVYYTGNLLGGKAGKQREYALHYMDNGYKLYVDLSDTLLVKSYDNIDAKSGDGYHYMVDVYTKQENYFNNYFLLQSDTNTGITEDSLFKYWNRELKNSKPLVITSLTLFPPK